MTRTFKFEHVTDEDTVEVWCEYTKGYGQIFVEILEYDFGPVPEDLEEELKDLAVEWILDGRAEERYDYGF